MMVTIESLENYDFFQENDDYRYKVLRFTLNIAGQLSPSKAHGRFCHTGFILRTNNAINIIINCIVDDTKS